MQEESKKLLEEAPWYMDGTAKTHAANHSFNMNGDSIKLPHDKAEFFHHIVAKLLFLRSWTNQGTQTAVAKMTIKS